MNKLLLICFSFFICTLLLNAQQRSISSNEVLKGPFFKSVKQNGIQSNTSTPDDTLSYLDPGAVYTVTGDGFVVGDNQYGDLGKYQRFDLTDSYLLKGFMFYTRIKVITGSADILSFVVKSVNNDGSPGATLATVNAATDLLNPNGWSSFTLSNPLPVGNSIFIGYEWSAAVNDTFGLACDQAGMGYGDGALRAWEKWSDDTYFAMDPSWGGFDVDLWIVAIAEKVVLPVELASFISVPNGRTVQLNWETKTEKNSDKFLIDRKTTATNWITVGSVKAAVLSNSPKFYTFTENNLQSGKYQYRLKMIDNDGSFEYSKVVEAEITTPKIFELSQNYPNPFNPSTKINYNIPFDSKVTLEVYNVTGERIGLLVNEEQSAGYYSVDFNSSLINRSLSSGVYFYRITAINKVMANNFSSIKKMILIK
jgi:hypothetical protein